VWRERQRPGMQAAVRTALAVFVAQLALNALWSWLFFAWRQGVAAFAEIVVLAAAILLCLVRFWRIRRIAGWLLVPYLAWVCFAAALAGTIWRRNPALLG
jgi:translocator protein